MIDYDYNGRLYKIIPLTDMEIGVYRGRCRNAEYAYWNGIEFIHLRTKFNRTFLDTIQHPENEYLYDVFLPFELIETEELEAVELLKAINDSLVKGAIIDENQV